MSQFENNKTQVAEQGGTAESQTEQHQHEQPRVETYELAPGADYVPGASTVLGPSYWNVEDRSTEYVTVTFNKYGNALERYTEAGMQRVTDGISEQHPGLHEKLIAKRAGEHVALSPEEIKTCKQLWGTGTRYKQIVGKWGPEDEAKLEAEIDALLARGNGRDSFAQATTGVPEELSEVGTVHYEPIEYENAAGEKWQGGTVGEWEDFQGVPGNSHALGRPLHGKEDDDL